MSTNIPCSCLCVLRVSVYVSVHMYRWWPCILAPVSLVRVCVCVCVCVHRSCWCVSMRLSGVVVCVLKSVHLSCSCHTDRERECVSVHLSCSSLAAVCLPSLAAVCEPMRKSVSAHVLARLCKWAPSQVPALLSPNPRLVVGFP